MLKASQAIASRIELEGLLAEMMQIVVENAGAERGLLVLDSADGLRIAAEHRIGSATRLLPGLPLEDSDRLAAQVVRYVARSQEAVVIADARNDRSFARDPYIRRAQPRSLLCSPVRRHGKLVAVIYLENNQAANAFSRERIELLDMLSSQIAISIENARLYRDISALNEAYARFVPRAFLSFLDKDSILDVTLGDQVQRDMTVLLSDIRNFTRMSEAISPGEAFGLLNDFLGRVTPAIQAQGGIIDKYVGDSVMALFPEGADAALNAAVAMLREKTALNRVRATAGLAPIEIGIGLHSGPVMLGIIGAETRMDGTVIGDTVNTASRIEQVTKAYGLSLAITKATYDALAFPGSFMLREIDRVQVAGRTEPVTVFEVFEADPPEQAAAKQRNMGRLAEVLARFRAGDLEGCEAEARLMLAMHPEDPVAAVYLRRCVRGLRGEAAVGRPGDADA